MLQIIRSVPPSAVDIVSFFCPVIVQQAQHNFSSPHMQKSLMMVGRQYRKSYHIAHERDSSRPSFKSLSQAALRTKAKFPTRLPECASLASCTSTCKLRGPNETAAFTLHGPSIFSFMDVSLLWDCLVKLPHRATIINDSTYFSLPSDVRQY